MKKMIMMGARSISYSIDLVLAFLQKYYLSERMFVSQALKQRNSGALENELALFSEA